MMHNDAQRCTMHLCIYLLLLSRLSSYTVSSKRQTQVLRTETSSYQPPSLFALRAVWECRVPQLASSTTGIVNIGIFTSSPKSLPCCLQDPCSTSSQPPVGSCRPLYLCLKKQSSEDLLQQCRINTNPATLSRIPFCISFMLFHLSRQHNKPSKNHGVGEYVRDFGDRTVQHPCSKLLLTTCRKWIDLSVTTSLFQMKDLPSRSSKQKFTE